MNCHKVILCFCYCIVIDAYICKDSTCRNGGTCVEDHGNLPKCKYVFERLKWISSLRIHGVLEQQQFKKRSAILGFCRRNEVEFGLIVTAGDTVLIMMFSENVFERT